MRRLLSLLVLVNLFSDLHNVLRRMPRCPVQMKTAVTQWIRRVAQMGVLSACAYLPTLVFSQPVEPPLLETEWRVASATMGAVTEKNPASLRFDANQRLSGSDGCNRLMGSYALDGARLTFTQIATTRMACPNVQGRDAAFGAALTRVDGWRIRGGVLELLGTGTVLLRFRPVGAESHGVAAPDCSAPTTQADMNSCAYEDFLAATGDYSAAYKAVMDTLQPPRRDQFRQVQTAWVRYRTAVCNFEASGAQGGSMQSMIKSQCDSRLTRSRTAEFRALIDCKEGDVACLRPKK